MSYYTKYMMYKQKYVDLKNILGGASTRGNSYQPALMNMLGGALIATFSGDSERYHNNTNEFVNAVLKEYDLHREPHDWGGTEPHITEFQIVSYTKRWTNNPDFDPTYQTNDWKYYSSTVLLEGIVPSLTSPHFRTILSNYITAKGSIRFIDVYFK
jgi:hypothetical protein